MPNMGHSTTTPTSAGARDYVKCHCRIRHARVLLVGTILASGRMTVSSALRAMGLGHQKRFHCYHRVLSHASWSSREVGRVLLGLLVEAFVPEGGPLVVGQKGKMTFPVQIQRPLQGRR